VIGGLGNGFAYATPIPVMAKWFPDKRGLAVELAVGGYGAGSAIFGPLIHLAGVVGVQCALLEAPKAVAKANRIPTSVIIQWAQGASQMLSGRAATLSKRDILRNSP